jgi:NAD(P)-dependent dehydrogenase (short-subunit alcohol dehydrogenase family)
MSEFQESKVAVFNCSSGIGLCVAQAFLKNGAHVVAIDEPDALEKAKQSLHAEGASRLHCVKSSSDSNGLLNECETLVGGLDVLVCAAPPVGQVPVLDMTADELRRTLEAELAVPALLMQAAGRRMAARGGGRIIVFFSMSAKTGVHTKVAPFAAAKGGLLAYARVMAAELAPTGVTVNSIATSLFEQQVENMAIMEREQLSKAIPVQRFGRPSEAAHAALFLASKEAAFITGETMNLSGGRFMD